MVGVAVPKTEVPDPPNTDGFVVLAVANILCVGDAVVVDVNALGELVAALANIDACVVAVAVPNTDGVVVVAPNAGACVVIVEPNTDAVVEEPKTEVGDDGAEVVGAKTDG